MIIKIAKMEKSEDAKWPTIRSRYLFKILCVNDSQVLSTTNRYTTLTRP